MCPENTRKAADGAERQPETFGEPMRSRLFAGFLGLLVAMLWARYLQLFWPSSYQKLAPILAYQDVLFWGLMAWGFHGLFNLASGYRSRWLVERIGWAFCAVAASYAGLTYVLYGFIRSPLTYRLWMLSDSGRGIQATVSEVLYPGLIVVTEVTLLAIFSARLMWVGAPRMVAKLRAAFHSRWGVAGVSAYIIGAHLWAAHFLSYKPAAENAELALLSSFFQPVVPIVTDKIPPEFYADFISRRDAAGPQEEAHPALAPMNAAMQMSKMNIVMVIMESVGTREMQLYGAPYHDNSELIRLARHSIVFDRIYAGQPRTSSAMASLFCSLYPEHGWRSITRDAPAIRATGIAEVFKRNGYRTAFMHEGGVAYEHEGAFLQAHGFNYIQGMAGDSTKPLDSMLIPDALKWIQHRSGRPFFLVLWTRDTHHPYLSALTENYGVGDQYLNRYLNGVHATDDIIGQLWRALSEAGLSDNTLLVVTGDHGEAFGEHNQTVHNFTLYNEETHVPLIFVNSRLFDREIHISRLGRQIDIPATLTALAGYQRPAEWQGASLFDGPPHRRAYLFSSDGNSTFGFVEGGYKYIYDYNREAPELYNLWKDPKETDNLASDPAYAAKLRQDHLRVEAWVSFQNSYLHSLGQ